MVIKTAQKELGFCLMTRTPRTYYRVAEHLFAVECKQPELLRSLHNYEPFITPETEELPLFSLCILHEGLLPTNLHANYTHAFTDKADDDMPRIEVYHKEGGWLIGASVVADSPICCEIECDQTFSQGVLHIDSACQDLRFCIDTSLMLMYAFRTAPLMTLEMHAAVVVKGEEARGDEAKGEEARGYLFLGHSGTGKSTHARMWLQAFPDAWLLNDDNPILRVMDDGEVRVYGSPWSGKTPCYKNQYVPVGAIVKLSQAPHNKLRKLSLPEAYAYILSSASGLKVESKMTDNMHETIRHIVTHVGCYHLDCLPNTEAAEVCWECREDPT